MPPSRLAIVAPGLGGSGGTAQQRQIALTPDGAAVLFMAEAPDGTDQLMRQSLDADQPTRIQGIPPDPASPAISPDGRWLLVSSYGQPLVKRYPLEGGPGEALPIQERLDAMSFLDWDGVHTTWEGAYLAAATIYAALFERSPEGLPYHLGISDGDAAFLQRIAWETVNDWEAGSRLAHANASADANRTTGRSTATSATQATAEEPLPG